MLLRRLRSSHCAALPAFLADDASVLDMNDAVGERQEPRIMGHDQHAARRVLGDLGQDAS